MERLRALEPALLEAVLYGFGKRLEECGALRSGETLPVVLIGGASLVMHGLRDRIEDIDLYLADGDRRVPGFSALPSPDEEVFAAFGVAPITVEPTADPALYNELDLGNITAASKAPRSGVLSVDVGGARLDLRVLPPAYSLITKSLANREKDFGDLQALTEAVSIEETANVVNQIAANPKNRGMDAELRDLVLGLIDAYELFALMRNEPGAEGIGKRLLDLLKVPQAVRDNVMYTRGMSDMPGEDGLDLSDDCFGCEQEMVDMYDAEGIYMDHQGSDGDLYMSGF